MPLGKPNFCFRMLASYTRLKAFKSSPCCCRFCARRGHKLVSVARSPPGKHSLSLICQECGQALQMKQGSTAILIEPFGRPCRTGVEQHPIQCRQPGTVQGGRQATCPIVQRTGLKHFFRVRGEGVCAANRARDVAGPKSNNCACCQAMQASFNCPLNIWTSSDVTDPS